VFVGNCAFWTRQFGTVDLDLGDGLLECLGIWRGILFDFVGL